MSCSENKELNAAFWDNLSEIPLTRRALKELDRRNVLTASLSFPQPLSTDATTEWRRCILSIKPAANFPLHCGKKLLDDIKLFARQGGPNLSDLRGFKEIANPFHNTMNPTDASAGGRSSGSVPAAEEKSITETTSTKSTGPYDRAFQQNLIDGSVYPRGYKYPDGRIPRKPANWDEINHRLAQRRASLSSSKFSAGAHETFVDADSNAFKEKEVGDSVIPIIGGRFKDARCVSGGVPFRNMAPLTDGTLVPGNPDIYHGARPEQLDQQVRSRLHDHIVPSTQDDLPMLPNFFLAVKGPDGSLAVAERQACYDGALGARAMHALRSFGNDEPVYDENAYSVTSTYHGGQLKMFTSHMTQPTSPSDRAEYIMTQVNGWSMTGNPETFRQGATAFRNARDWTKEQRDQAIEKANMRQTGALC